MSFLYLLGLIKPAGDPLVEVAGAYFPAWLAAGVAGGVVTSVLWGVCAAGRRRVLIDPPGWMLPLWFVIFTGGIWLLFFSAR